MCGKLPQRYPEDDDPPARNRDGVVRMLTRKKPKISPAACKERFVSVEILESRTLLSASTGIVHPNLLISPLAAGSGLAGYTVSQIKHAYGFDQVSADGAG